MTAEEQFMEIFHHNILTKDEIVDELSRTKIATSFPTLLRRGFIRSTGRSASTGEEFYAPNRPSWIKMGYPVSRLEAQGRGANYKMPLRLEKIFVNYLEQHLKWDRNNMLLWWNSTFARHLTDALPGHYHLYPTRAAFMKFLEKHKKQLLTDLAHLRREEPQYNQQSAETYYKDAANNSIMSLISSMFRGEILLKDQKTLAWLAKHKPTFISNVFKKTFWLS